MVSERWGRLASPHHYGTHLGNYHSCHLGLAVPNYGFVEWDEASTPGISAPGYAVADGYADGALYEDLRETCDGLASVSDQSHGRVIIRIEPVRVFGPASE